MKCSIGLLLALAVSASALGENSASTNRPPEKYQPPSKPATTAEIEKLLTAKMYGYKEAKYFVVVCMPSGSLKEVFGAELAPGLQDFIKLRLKNNLSKIPIKTINEAGEQQDRDFTGLTWFSVSVDTAGTGDYPIAYNVRLVVQVTGSCNQNENSMVGICRRDQLETSVKNAIAQFIESFVVEFMKARGEF
jgi:hypothetical protein